MKRSTQNPDLTPEESFLEELFKGGFWCREIDTKPLNIIERYRNLPNEQKTEVSAEIQNLLNTLDPRNKFVFEKRIWQGATLEETGGAIGVCREEARRLLCKGYRKMRSILLTHNLAKLLIPENKELFEFSLDSPVNSLNLSCRALNALNNLYISTVRQLTEYQERFLSRQRNCGKKTVQEIKEALRIRGLSLKS